MTKGDKFGVSRALKLYQQTGVRSSTGVKRAKVKKLKFTPNNDDGHVAKAPMPKHRVNPASAPHFGVRYRDLTKLRKRMERGLEVAKAIAARKGDPTPRRAKNFHEIGDAQEAIENFVQSASGRPDLVREFVTHFLSRLLTRYHFSHYRDSEIELRVLVISDFFRRFWTNPRSGRELRDLILSMENLSTWKRLIKLYGYLVVDRCRKLSGKNVKLYGIPEQHIVPAMEKFFARRLRDKTYVFAGAGERRSKLINRGTGGKSKVKRAPLPPLPKKQPALKARSEQDQKLPLDDLLDLVGSIAAKKNVVADSFVYSSPPNVAMLMGRNDVPYKFFDCFGAPYCGLVCIDIAHRIKPVVSDYIKRDGSDEPWNVVGVPSYLAAYASYRGSNLKIVNGHGAELVRFENCPEWKWVVLCYDEPLLDGPGHYRLGLLQHADISGKPLEFEDTVVTTNIFGVDVSKAYVRIGVVRLLVAALGYVCYRYQEHRGVACSALCSWLLSIRRTKGLELSRSYTTANNDDSRSFVDRRDDLIHNESYRVVVEHNSVDLLFYRFDFERRYTFMEQRVKHIMKEMESLAAEGRDPLLALSTLATLREINMESHRPGLISGTAEFCRYYASTLTYDPHKCHSTVGLIAYNTPGDQSVMPEPDVLMAHQVDGLAGGGVNHVQRLGKDLVKVNVPVAVAPIGVPVSSIGPVGPGMIGVTDGSTLLSGFANRAMTKDLKSNDPASVADWVKCGKRLMKKCVDESALLLPAKTGDFVQDNVDTFKRVYKGKKSAAWINSTVNDYLKYSRGEMSVKARRKYRSHGIFTKFESNIKILNGRPKMKPRNIMVMSPLMLMELIQVVEVLHCIYEGPISKYQIKGLEPDEVRAKVANACRKPHMVTDMTAFESSLGVELRKVENYAIERALKRAGLYRVLSAFRRHVYSKRVLRSKYADFAIFTRCSGDFWTSFGNGVANITNVAYCAEKLGLPLEVIAEGDDGLVPRDSITPELLGKVGMKFSSSVSGTQPGDCDFLRTLWAEGETYLNIGRALSIFWVKKGSRLKQSKQKWLLRQAALSLHHRSPGHPILSSVVERIGRETAGHNDFKGSKFYLDPWKTPPKDTVFPRSIEVKEHMRGRIAAGTTGFPPIPISAQLSLEDRISNDNDIYIGSILDDYDDIKHPALAFNGYGDTSTSGYTELRRAISQSFVE